jgi:hypothetical protein
MREETVTAVRYCPILGCEVVVRLTYEVGEGPRPDIVRWFLVRQEMLNLQPSQGLIWRDDASQGRPKYGTKSHTQASIGGTVGAPSTG